MTVLASAHPASVRLLVALAGVVLFGALSSVRLPGGLPVASVAVPTVLVVIWMFGATLIWGTGYPSKFRWAAGWESRPGAWQSTALLAVAFAGVVAVGGSLRACAARDRWRARATEGVAAGCFVCWSAVVNYSVIVAVVMGVLGLRALHLAYNRNAAPAVSIGFPSALEASRRLGMPLVIATTIVTLAWLAYAVLWAVFREGENVVCGCWADSRNAWQYGVQLLVAFAGSAALISTTALYRRARGSAWIAGGVTLTAMIAWIAFVATGT